MSVLLGGGDGTFRTQTVYAVRLGPTSVAVADLTDADRLDIITTNELDGTVSVLFAAGGGTFQAARTLAAGQLPVMTVVTDVNEDGIPDLATAGNHDNTISVRLGNGAGDFQAAWIAGGTGRSTPRSSPT